jgi:competence protein ComEC
MQASTRPALAEMQEQLASGLPLLWVSLFFLAGILLASWIHLAVWSWLLLAAAAVLAALLLRRLVRIDRSAALPLPLMAVYFAALFLGAARYQLAVPRPTAFDIAFYNDRQYDVLVTGWVAEMPDRRDTYTNLRLHVEAVDTGDGDMPARGLILARVGENDTFHYGQRLRLRGLLRTPPEDEDFSYRDYLAARGILSYMPAAAPTRLPGQRGNPFSSGLYALKENSLGHIYRLFPDPEASLLAGILLGVDTGLTRALQNAFKDTGTAHIIAISGFNISIIAAVFVFFFSRWLGSRRGGLLAFLAVGFYTLLVGADASVLRAALMGFLGFLAWQVGRRNLGINTLAFVALIMTAINPLFLWDAGFQLSFLATLGLILYAGPLTALAGRALSALHTPAAALPQILPPLTNFVLLTFAAQIATLPVMAYHFKRLSLISLIANPFILPAQPAVMIIGGLALFLSLLVFPLGQLVAWLAWPFVEYTIRAVELFDRLPGGTLYLGNTSPWLVGAFYILLFGITLSWPRLKGSFDALRARLGSISLVALLAGLLALTLLVWRSIAALPDGDLHLTFLSVGSADAVLIQTPSGHSVLVNGGPSASELSDDLGRRLPVFRRKLDWLVVGSTAENQVSSLPRLLERYPPQSVLWSGNVDASFSSRQVDGILAEGSIPVIYAEEGQRLDLGDEAYIEVQAVGPRGSVLLLQWRDFRALLPVGMSADTLEQLEYGNKIGPVDVLLLADSGFFATNSVDWVDNLHPQLVVLSVAAGDPNGLPDPEALDSVGGYPLLRTDRNGWIEVSTDGTEMRVEAQRR